MTGTDAQAKRKEWNDTRRKKSNVFFWNSCMRHINNTMNSMKKEWISVRSRRNEF